MATSCCAVATAAEHAPRDPRGALARSVQPLIVHNGAIELLHDTVRTSMSAELVHDPELAALHPKGWVP